MIRDPVVVKTSQATALGCHEARQSFVALLAGPASLTERALVEAHLNQCAGCRQAEARLRQVLTAHRVTPSRALTAGAGLIQAIRPGIGQSLALIPRLRVRLAVALALTARAITGVIQGAGRGISGCVAWVARLPVSLAIRFTSSARATVNVIVAIRSEITRIAKRVVRPRPWSAIPIKTCLRAVGVMLVLALTAYTLQWTSRPQPPAGATAHPGARIELMQVVSVLPPPPAEPVVEPTGAASAAPPIEEPRRSPSNAASLAPPARAAIREAAPTVQESVPEHEAPVVTVVGRLSARSRTAVERDLTALLADVGGTELGRQRHTAFIAVHVAVARSRYDDFTRGLTRIGSWQLEAERSPLPDEVHMTIRLSG